MNITAELLSEWMNEAADEATEELRAEITQLRAELAESRASEHGLFGRLETCRQDEAALKAEFEQERELADRLVKQLKSWTSDEPDYDDDAEALTAYAARRNKRTWRNWMA